MPSYLRRLLFIGLAGAIAFAAAFWWFERWVDQPGPLPETRLVVLPRGEGVAGVAERLRMHGAITDARLFRLAAWWTDQFASLRAGEYAIEAGASPRGILAQLAAGRVHRRKLTIPEGHSSAEILRLVQQAEAMVGDVGPELVPEGRLLPETYQYIYGDDRAEMLRRMARARDELLARLWPARDQSLPISTEQQAMVLASMVEAETPRADERPLVAGVFINRLRRGMKLQSDPTVVYGMTLGRRELERPLSRADLQQPTLWNTYVIEGLPPTPINHPGRASIAAVLNPASTRFLYFVADGSGGHMFSETYDQHLRNVAAYRAQQGVRP